MVGHLEALIHLVMGNYDGFDDFMVAIVGHHLSYLTAILPFFQKKIVLVKLPLEIKSFDMILQNLYYHVDSVDYL